ncbi:MAG TPA: metallophosphoesterase [Opitutaceae bacterium]|nr:metallophosphoesterase [Opitutaceae bacterium]
MKPWWCSGRTGMFAVGALLAFGVVSLAARPSPDAVLVEIADVHSAYDRMPQIVAQIDAVLARHPNVPRAILLDGDLFEGANVVGRRSHGEIELSFLRRLVQTAPTVFTLGNHEPEFFGMDETVARIRATGAIVISATVRDRASGRPYAPASTRLDLGGAPAVIVGLTTNHLTTFRPAVRSSLDLLDPVAWAREHLRSEFAGAPITIVASHAGLAADRLILPLVPDGTLFVGAHDHLAFVQKFGRTVYFQAGSWGSDLAVITLRRDADGRSDWNVELRPISPDAPADAELRRVVDATLAKSLTPDDAAIVGDSPVALSPAAAARFATAAARDAAHTDVAVIGGTTFGAGLPRGAVNRYAFDACVRFDGPLYVGEISGAQLQALAARCNQGATTPFAERTGENLVLVGPDRIKPDRMYRLVTTDWIARNPTAYLGQEAPSLRPADGLMLKAAVIAALHH